MSMTEVAALVLIAVMVGVLCLFVTSFAKTLEELKKADRERKEKQPQVPQRRNVKHNLRGIIGGCFLVLFWLFVAYLFFGGTSSNSSRSIYIDCSDPGNAKYNRYCNGTYQDETNQQDATENSYYQNVVR